MPGTVLAASWPTTPNPYQDKYAPGLNLASGLPAMSQKSQASARQNRPVSRAVIDPTMRRVLNDFMPEVSARAGFELSVPYGSALDPRWDCR
jgi:hypothetical protein